MLVGLTGKSCSGKNYAALYMESAGWKVLDLDVIGHNLINENRTEIEALFGTSSRSELSKVVFSNPDKRKLLENILYPKMIQIIRKETDKNRITVANGALLYRAGIDKICDVVVYIDASYEVRLSRALQRDVINEEGFKLRDSAQPDVDFRDVKYRAKKLVVIDNNEDCTAQLKKVCSEIQTDSGSGYSLI